MQTDLKLQRKLHLKSPLKTLCFALWFSCSVAMADVYLADMAAVETQVPHFGVSLELGVNSLTSIGGVTLSYFPIPKLALDMGTGFGLNALKYGGRLRYFVYEPAPFHAYFGLGFNHALGWDPNGFDMNLKVTKNGVENQYDFRIRVDATDFVDFVGGYEFRQGHFTASGGLGYSQQLGGKNWRILSGNPPPKSDLAFLDQLYGGGISVFVEMGFLY